MIIAFFDSYPQKAIALPHSQKRSHSHIPKSDTYVFDTLRERSASLLHPIIPKT
ncbi:hypothetical protein [Anabaena sp. UHCC 0451]|uniref:hypothetical protein n=1 Tax=Anabaena sp. UHCC 0451 TaxID=2055235 RepID=UPI002B209AC5|nr:hypothetical protein [Anabaena sp. UHCC 0451]MEA5579515.1 hypothetical protein [Anabaena sp. UHCC 0451]